MRRTFILFLLAFNLFDLSAQSGRLRPDTNNSSFFIRMENDQRKEIDSFYVAESGTGKEYVNGSIYIPYYTRAEHKPLLFNGKETSSSLVYKGRLFSNVPLIYDTYLDQVVYGDTSIVFNNVVSKIALNPGNISRFTLYPGNDTLLFRYFSDETDPLFNLEKGFYESVYNGRCQYIIRHKSHIYKRNGIDEYSYIPEGYLSTGNNFVRITSQRQFMNLFGTASDRIRSYLREKGIRIRRADKHQVADILKFYEKAEAAGQKNIVR